MILVCVYARVVGVLLGPGDDLRLGGLALLGRRLGRLLLTPLLVLGLPNRGEAVFGDETGNGEEQRV
jgi:hypothetical protein